MKAAQSLEGKRIQLRPMESGDVEALTAMIYEPAVRPWWGNEDRSDIEELLTDKEVEVWVIETLDGEFIGMIQSYEQNEPDYRHAGMDISLTTKYQNQGYGTEALRLVAKYLFGKGHHRLIIDPDASNERAIAAYKKLGYKPVGVMRQYSREVGGDGWHDGLLMDLLKAEFKEA